jgi:PAS domain-containing protein
MSGAPERNEFSVVASERKEVPPDGSQTDRNNLGFDDSDLSRLSFLSEVVRLLPAGMTVQDEQGNFILANAAAAAQFNMPVRDIVGTASGAAFRSRELNDRIGGSAIRSDQGFRRTRSDGSRGKDLSHHA